MGKFLLLNALLWPVVFAAFSNSWLPDENSYMASDNETECGPFNLPIIENFDSSNEIPSCWSAIGAEIIHYGGYYSEPNSLHLNLVPEGHGFLISPEISADLNTLRISFYAVRYPWHTVGEEPQLLVGTIGDPADLSTFTALTSFHVPDLFESGFRKFVFYLDKYSGSDSYIAFKLEGEYSPDIYELMYIDDIVIEQVPDCPEPWSLSAEEITGTSALLSWKQSGDIDKWIIAFDEEGFDPGSEGLLIEHSGSESYELINLKQGVNYQFYVRAVCNDEPGAWSIPCSFTAECGPFGIPLTENFDSSDEIPACWTASGADIRERRHNSDPHSLRLTHGFYEQAFLISPEIATDLRNLRVSFHALRSNDLTFGQNPELLVGTVSDPGDISTFIKAASFNVMDVKESEFQHFMAYFDVLEGNDAFIAFLLDGSGSEIHGRMLIDDVVIETIPECAEPWGLNTGYVDRTSAVINWRSTGSISKWDLVYGKKGFSDKLVKELESQTYELTGLEPGTLYEFSVRAWCNEETGAWSDPFIFFTDCPVYDLPYRETFRSSGFPHCWSQTNSGNADSEVWEVQNKPNVSTHWLVKRYKPDSGLTRLITPEIDMSMALSVNLKFRHTLQNWDQFTTIKIQSSTDGINWIDEHYFEGIESYQQTKDVPITNISANTYIAWVIDGDHDYVNWYIDDIHITFEPATPEIEWPAASPITYGEALSESNLEGGMAAHNGEDVEGRFRFDNPKLMPDPGENQQFNVTFWPVKAFNPAKGSVMVQVKKADPYIIWPEASTLTSGEELAQSILTGGTGRHKGVNVPGDFIFAQPGLVPEAGDYFADVIFIPDNQDFFNSVTGQVNVSVKITSHSPVYDADGTFGGLLVFPNPFTSSIMLLNAREVERFRMINVKGETVIDILLTGSESVTIDTGMLTHGIYLISIFGENGEVITRSMIRR